jgi:hypothetical protein
LPEIQLVVYRAVAGYKVATEEGHALAHRPESVHMNLLKGVLHIHMLYVDVSCPPKRCSMTVHQSLAGRACHMVANGRGDAF